MKTIKVSEASGPALDWMVAKANQAAGLIKSDPMLDCMNYFTPTTNWAQGGPIIDREELTLSHSPYDHVSYGRTRPWCAEKKSRMEYGPTPLIAACRCYVASKLGDEVEVPGELTS